MRPPYSLSTRKTRSGRLHVPSGICKFVSHEMPRPFASFHFVQLITQEE
jgi:hypothetical protein